MVTKLRAPYRCKKCKLIHKIPGTNIWNAHYDISITERDIDKYLKIVNEYKDALSQIPKNGSVLQTVVKLNGKYHTFAFALFYTSEGFMAFNGVEKGWYSKTDENTYMTGSLYSGGDTGSGLEPYHTRKLNDRKRSYKHRLLAYFEVQSKRWIKKGPVIMGRLT